MEIFIRHQGKQTGPFSAQQIREGLAGGLYQPSDLVWHQGLEGWIPLAGANLSTASAAPLPGGVPPENSGLAITSMALGISGFFCGITAIPALICGHLALGKIKRSQGRLTGGGFAIAGLVTGYTGLVFFVIIIIAFISGLTAPMVIRQRKKADQAEAVSNARQISLALAEFESDYGSFPNAATSELVASDAGESPITGSSANARFRQLFQSGVTAGEEFFYAKASGTQKPDGEVTGGYALAPGECGFGYIDNIRTDDDTPRPIAMAPFVKGSDRFDPMPFDGKAVVLWSDSAVRSMPIERATGEILLDGKNMLDPSHPVWGGVPPSLLLPE